MPYKYIRTAPWVVLLAVAAFIAAPGIARANDWGFANSNDTNGYDGYASYYNSTAFANLMNSPSNGPAKYQRFFVFWESAATSNGSSCVTPTAGSDFWNLAGAMQKAEAAGQTPLISIEADPSGYDKQGGANGYQWPSGASLPTNPTDLDMICATDYLYYDLNAYNLLPYTVPIESYNEPENASIGNSCNPNALYVEECAARYFADVYVGTEFSGTGKAHVIAGTFTDANANSTISGGGSACGQGGVDWNYICWLTRGDGAGNIPVANQPLSSFNQYATSWSFHDYDDVRHSYNCTSSGGSACVSTDATNMKNLLSSTGEPTSDIWMTEAGCRAPGGGLCANATQAQQGNEAEGWEFLRYSGVAHSFWYEWQWDPSWDSGLLDQSGNARQDYCVLLSGYATAGNCTGH